MHGPAELHLEDFHEGQVFTGAARFAMSAEEVKAFAAEFDPQPFHLDEGAAGGASSAGWWRAAGTPPPIRCGCWSGAN